MIRTVLAFDLDGTLAVTKSPITDRMATLLTQLLEHYRVCVITGGTFDQVRQHVIKRLPAKPERLNNLHVMPTSGTRYYRYDEQTQDWVVQYSKDLTEDQKKEIIPVVEASAKELGFWIDHPVGEIIEDRGTQITYSALGQRATPEDKKAWDPDGSKKKALREKVQPQLPDYEVRINGKTSIDTTVAGIDKAFGMQQLIEALHIDKSEILFIGDDLFEGGNDYPVKAFGIDCIHVDRWEDTAFVVEGILAVS